MQTMNFIAMIIGYTGIAITVGIALYAIVDVLRRKKADRG